MADYRYRDSHSRDRDGGRYFDEDRRGRDERGGGMFGMGRSGRDDDRDYRSRESGRWSGASDRDRDEERGHSPRWDRSRDEGYGPDDHRRGLPMDETGHLIASNKVEGTAVYGRDGERLGSIFNFMVDKFSGRVEYVVMTYGGFMGLGERYYPLPWRVLTYDCRAGGYRIGMSKRDLESAPSFDRNSEPEFNERYGRRVHDHYGLKY